MTLAAAIAAPRRWQRYCTDEQWRALVLDGLPEEVQARALADARVIERAPRCDFGPGSFAPAALANGHVRRVARDLGDVDFELVESEAAIRERAERFAFACVEWPTGVSALLQVAGVEAPAGPGVTPAGARARLQCPRWWRRRLRATLGQRAENALRRVGHVRKGRAPYVSDYSLRRRREQRARGRDAMESARLIHVEGVQLPLLEVAAGSVSNPRVRRAEFMVRARGFEEAADELGHRAAFWTLTAPSAFHPWTAVGVPNPRYDARACGDVGDARAWQQRSWARVRAKFARLSLQLYGFRVAEPHHDGTPHWHLLLFGSAAALATAEKVIASAWLEEYADEPGAKENRVKVKHIDRSQGTATGYIAKYISKNLDGHGIDGHGRPEDDEVELPTDEGVDRVEAWASTHRVRQFQQIGGPPVGLWRELRRLREPVANAAIEAARLAADAADWRGFIRAVGGIDAGRNTAVRVWTEATGELNTYGEPRGPQPAGVESGPGRIRTRSAKWRLVWGATANGADRRVAILRSFPALGPVAITVRGAPGRQLRPCALNGIASGRWQPERAMRQLEWQTGPPVDGPPGSSTGRLLKIIGSGRRTDPVLGPKSRRPSRMRLSTSAGSARQPK